MWNCICECGNKTVVMSTNLIAGQVRSCGCLRKDTLSSMTPYNFDDLTGKIFGDLTVIGIGAKVSPLTSWLCKCKCGVIKNILRGNLISGRQVSCGCHNRIMAKKSHTTHGLSRTRIYKIWSGMISRCYNSKVENYSSYGGRGICVSDEWKRSFETFYNDMNGSYKEHLELDRVDVNGNYCKENCRWVTTKENARNKRNTLYLTIDGHTKPLCQWAEESNVNYYRAHERFYKTSFNGSQILFGKIKHDIDKMLPNIPQ